MQKLLNTLIIIIFCISIIYSQNREVVIKMNDGKQISGQIIEQKIGEYIKIIVPKAPDTITIMLDDIETVSNITKQINDSRKKDSLTVFDNEFKQEKEQALNARPNSTKNTHRKVQISFASDVGVQNFRSNMSLTDELLNYGFGLGFHYSIINNLKIGIRGDLVTYAGGEIDFISVSPKLDIRYTLARPKKWIHYNLVCGIATHLPIAVETSRFIPYDNGFTINAGIGFNFNFTKNTGASLDLGFLNSRFNYSSVNSLSENLKFNGYGIYSQLIIFF
jgi:hypothetical protein